MTTMDAYYIRQAQLYSELRMYCSELCIEVIKKLEPDNMQLRDTLTRAKYILDNASREAEEDTANEIRRCWG